MNQFSKLVQKLDHYKLIDAALIMMITMLVVIYKMNKAQLL